MKKIKKHFLKYKLIILLFFSPFISSYAQKAPVCETNDLSLEGDSADEYFRTMQRACRDMNDGIYDSVRYYLEKAIFFKGFNSVPQEKRKQLLNYLGKEKFTKLPCFCTDQAHLEELDSLNTLIEPMIDESPGEIVLDSATKKDMEGKALIKCHQFVDYIKIVTGKKSSRDVINNAIESAVSLFVNENCKIEVSSVNKNIKTKYPVRKYFQKLSALNQTYDQVVVSGSNYYIVSGLRKGPDGNYYTIVTFEQVFSGYHKDQIAYTDLTRKNIIVMVIQLKKMQEGAFKSVWDVLLKEVQVMETL